MAQTPEMILKQLADLKPQLPEGYEIVETAQLETILLQKNTLQRIFGKFSLILNGFSGNGGGSLPEMMGQIAPLIPQLQADEQLKNDLQTAQNFV
jgi:hypothetical protein